MASTDEVRTANLKLKLPEAAIKAQELSKAQEIAYMMAVQGEDPTTWLVPAAGVATTQLGTGQSGNASTTKKFQVPKQFIDEAAILRISGSGGATPTVTVTVQGSVDAAFTSPVTLSIADSATPQTFSAAAFIVTTASAWTVYKVVQPHQNYQFLRVNYSLNTNVTALAADVWYMGSPGALV